MNNVEIAKNQTGDDFIFTMWEFGDVDTLMTLARIDQNLRAEAYITALTAYTTSIGDRLNKLAEEAALFGWHAGRYEGFLQNLNQEISEIMTSSVKQRARIETLKLIYEGKE